MSRILHSLALILVTVLCVQAQCNGIAANDCASALQPCLRAASNNVEEMCSCLGTFYDCLYLVDCSNQYVVDSCIQQKKQICPKLSCVPDVPPSPSTTPSNSSSPIPTPTATSNPGDVCPEDKMLKLTQTFASCSQSAGSSVEKICSCVQAFFNGVRGFGDACWKTLGPQLADSCKSIRSVCPNADCDADVGALSFVQRLRLSSPSPQRPSALPALLAGIAACAVGAIVAIVVIVRRRRASTTDAPVTTPAGYTNLAE